MGSTHLGLGITLRIQLLVEGPGVAVAQQVPRRHQGGGRHVGQPCCHRLGCRQAVISHFPDHAPIAGLRRAELVASHGQRHGTCQPEPLGQEPTAARIGHQANLAEGLDKTGTGRGNRDITSQCQ